MQIPGDGVAHAAETPQASVSKHNEWRRLQQKATHAKLGPWLSSNQNSFNLPWNFVVHPNPWILWRDAFGVQTLWRCLGLNAWHVWTETCYLLPLWSPISLHYLNHVLAGLENWHGCLRDDKGFEFASTTGLLENQTGNLYMRMYICVCECVYIYIYLFIIITIYIYMYA